MNEEKIPFNITLRDGSETLRIVSNFTGDKDEFLSKNIIEELGSEDLFFVEIPTKNDDAYMSITLEQAEELVRELSKAIEFVKG